MDVIRITGLIVACLAMLLSTYLIIRKWEIDSKYRFKAFASAEYLKVRKEADGWRKAYEEEHAKVLQYEALLRVQDLVYGKVKLKDAKNLHDRK